MRAICGGALAAALLAVANSALSEADGPDFYRVADAEVGEALIMRVGPTLDHPALGAIPGDADGIANFGCQGDAGTQSNMCLVGFDRLVGWVDGRLLAEGGAPDRFSAGARLRGLAGSEWGATRFGAEEATDDAWIGFKSDGSVLGSSGCNRFTGAFQEGVGTLTIGPLAVSRRACPPPQMALESKMLGALEAARRKVAAHLVLALLDEDGAVLAQFARRDFD